MTAAPSLEQSLAAKVSIIIPAYNPGAFLRAALRSIHEQTYEDWEVVVVDDHSAEDLSWIPNEFPRARWIRQEHGGVSVARNRGILSTGGEYVAFMDQDDVWRPEKLRRQVDAMGANPDAAICYCDLEIVDEHGRAWDRAATPPAGEGTSKLVSPVVELEGAVSPDGVSQLHRSIRHFSSRFVVPSTVMIRRPSLASSGLLDPFIPFSGDYDLLIKLGSKHKVIRVPQADVLYRKHSNNFSDQYEVGRREVKALIARYVSYAKSVGDKPLARDAAKLFGRPRRMYAAQAIDRSRRSLRVGNRKEFACHLARAFWFSPLFASRSVGRWCVARVTGRPRDGAC